MPTRVVDRLLLLICLVVALGFKGFSGGGCFTLVSRRRVVAPLVVIERRRIDQFLIYAKGFRAKAE